MKAAELAKFKKLLLKKKSLLASSVSKMEDEVLKKAKQDISVDHMADAGSDSFEQDFNLSLIENEEETWHNRAGHVSELKRTIETGAIRGKVPNWANLKKMDKHIPCLTCLGGKMTQRSYPGATDPVKWKAAESLHIDNCEMPVPSLGRERHEFEVEDEASGCTNSDA